MTYKETQYRVLNVLLWLFYWASLAAAPVLYFVSPLPGREWPLLLGHPLVVAAIFGHRRHAPWVPHLLLGVITVTATLAPPAAYIGFGFNLAFFVIPMLGLIVASAPWVLGASALGYAALLIRSGFSPIYTEPMTVIICTVVVGGIATARYLVDAAIRRAERQARLLKEQARLLADERANLAQRVAERTRELLDANAALAQANSTKSEFLAVVSHELRTPLNIILGNAELVEDEVYGPLNEPQRRALERMSLSGKHLLSLINDLIDVAAMEHGSLTLIHTRVDLDLFCAGLIDMVEVAAHKKGLRFKHDVAAGLPPLSGDERRLRQILLNLLMNAVKFTPEGGSVGLTVAADAVAGWVRFTVSDTGIGIAPEQQPAIFTPFLQLDGGLARSHEGAGLGLTLVDQLTRLHGGTVELESVPGAGSRFTVRLPCDAAIPVSS